MAKKRQETNGLMEKAYLVGDFGNSLVKVILLNAEGKFVSCADFPHAIRSSDMGSFEAGRKNRRSDKLTYAERFSYAGAPVAVGNLAEIGADKKRAGGPKYERDYIGLLFASAALRLLPDGHDNLTAMVMHPPSDIGHAPALRNAIGGVHTIKTANDKTIKYKVREVLSMDEPVGGLRHFLLDWGGLTYRQDDVDERMALCIDVGGGVSSFTPFNRQGVVDYQRAEDLTFDVGIHQIMRDLSRLLKATESAFKPHRESTLPFDANMRNAIHRGIYNWNGRDLPIQDLRDEATRPVISRLRDEWESQILGTGFSPAYVIVTGGGGGVLFDKIIVDVLEGFAPHNIFLAETDFGVIHYANPYGAAKVMQAIISRNETQV